jgi:hypothetical protein
MKWTLGLLVLLVAGCPGLYVESPDPPPDPLTESPDKPAVPPAKDPPAPEAEAPELTVAQTHDIRRSVSVDVKPSADTTILRITSAGGIGWAKIRSKNGVWPRKMVVRLYYMEGRGFKALEGFEARTDAAVRSAVPVAVRKRRGEDCMEVELTDLPAKGKGELFIRWIDYYR